LKSHGDYRGTASTDLSIEEAWAVVDAGDFTDPRVPLDDDETALVTRLRSLLDCGRSSRLAGAG
jgi:hypothetical protein